MSSIASEFLKRLGYMWYIVNPNDHLYAKIEDVPDYYKEVRAIILKFTFQILPKIVS